MDQNYHSVAQSNALFACLGLKSGLISKDRVIRAFTEWLFDKSKTLGDILCSHNSITEDQKKRIETLASEHLLQVGDQKVLASLDLIKTLGTDLEHLEDNDLLQTMKDAITIRNELGLDELNTKNQNSLLPKNKNINSPTASPKNSSEKNKDRFERQQFLEAGNLGEVYSAYDSELNRNVVAKYIRPELTGESLSEALFHLEGEVTGALEHPGIVPVYGLGKDCENRMFYAMRHIHGRKLTRVIAEYQGISHSDSGRKQEALVGLLQNFQAACLTIEYAHKKGVLHCDIKPDNIMVGDYGEVFVVDWGLVVVNGDPTNNAEANRFSDLPYEVITPYIPSVKASEGLHEKQGGIRRSIGGTPAYMAPEQLKATIHDDVALMETSSDIYALGSTLYQILTGSAPHLPLKGNQETIEGFYARILRGKFPAPRSLNPAIDKGLEAIVLKAMNLEPAKRYESPRKMEEDVRRWIADEPVHAFSEPAMDSARRWVRKNRVIVGACLFLLVLTTLGAMGFGFTTSHYNQELGRSEKQAQLNARQAIQEKERAEANEKLTLEQKNNLQASVYFNEIVRAQIEWNGLQSYFAPYRLAALPFARRDWEHDYLFTLQNKNLFDFKGNNGGASSICFSPDGKRVASAGFSPLVGDKILDFKIWDVTSGEEVFSINFPEHRATGICFNPDGKSIAVVSAKHNRSREGSMLRIIDVASGKEIFSHSEDAITLQKINFSPKGDYFAISSNDKIIRIWDAQNFKVTQTLAGHSEAIENIAFSPDGKRLLSSSYNNPWKVWDIVSGKEILVPPVNKVGAYNACLSPDGRFIAANNPSGVLLIDATSGAELHKFKGHLGVIRCLAFSPDGRWIASGGQDNLVKIWDVNSASEIRTIKGFKTFITSIAFSPDGRKLLLGKDSFRGENSLALFDLCGEENGRTFVNKHPFEFKGACFSPDGKILVTGGSNDLLDSWEVASGKKIQNLARHPGTINCVNFSPDGKLVVSCSGTSIRPEKDRSCTIQVIDYATKKILHTLRNHTNIITEVSFSRDGARILSSSWDGTLKIWDVVSGKEVLTINAGLGEVNVARFCPESRIIASAAGGVSKTIYDELGRIKIAGMKDLINPGGDIKLWNAFTGEPIRTMVGHTTKVLSLAFSPTGNWIASCGLDKSIRLWDVVSGREILTFKNNSPANNDIPNSLAFSPNGKRIVVGYSNSILKLWDTTTGEEVISPKIELGDIKKVEFSPDGKNIICLGNFIKLLDGTFKMDSQRVMSADVDPLLVGASISADGRNIFGTNTQGVAKIWDVETGEEIPATKENSRTFSPGQSNSSDGIWSVKSEKFGLFLVNNQHRSQGITTDKNKLAAWHTPDPDWHEQQALDSEKSGNWFAATFHWKSILNIKRDDTAAQQRLDNAQKMLSSQRK